MFPAVSARSATALCRFMTLAIFRYALPLLLAESASSAVGVLHRHAVTVSRCAMAIPFASRARLTVCMFCRLAYAVPGSALAILWAVGRLHASVWTVRQRAASQDKEVCTRGRQKAAHERDGH